MVEPNPSAFQKCITNRSNSIVENYALVSRNYTDDFISGNFGDPSHPDGYAVGGLCALVADTGDYCDDVMKKEKADLHEQKLVKVPTITLTDLLIKHNIKNIDFFSLDVEGYEVSVLNGLDFEVYRPAYILIETANRVEYQDKIRSYMEEKNYTFVERLSGNDDLFVDLKHYIL